MGSVTPARGYTLIEVLVSLLVMLIILLGLIQGMSIYITHNLKNTLRTEAIKIAQGCAEDLRNKRNCPSTVYRTFRNFKVRFDVNATDYSSLNPGLNSVTIKVTYSFKGQNYEYQLNTVIEK